MITIRPAGKRGHFNHGWLDTYHTFSFASYYDPQHMGFRALRVINEDRVRPADGFDMHSHRDMEIITYILEGALEHKDSMGNGSVILPGDVQRMSAGTGVSHSEFNHSDSEMVHLLQIWILPESKGLTPEYEQKTFTESDKRGRLCLVASHDGRDGSVTIHQDIDLYATSLLPRETVQHQLAAGRHAWLQVARGSITLNGHQLLQGDGAAISDETSLEIVGLDHCEALLFDLN